MTFILFCYSSSTNCVFDILGEVGVELKASLGQHILQVSQNGSLEI